MVSLSNLRFWRIGCRCSLSSPFILKYGVHCLHHQKANLFGEMLLVYLNKSLNSKAYQNVGRSHEDCWILTFLSLSCYPIVLFKTYTLKVAFKLFNLRHFKRKLKNRKPVDKIEFDHLHPDTYSASFNSNLIPTNQTSLQIYVLT